MTLFSSGCARKQTYICANYYIANRPSIDSRVSKLEKNIAIDTVIASISGRIYGKDSSDTDVSLSKLFLAPIWVVDQKTGEKILCSSDTAGRFQLSVPASSYDLKAKYLAYNQLIVRDLKIGPGDICKVEIVLGQANTHSDSTVYRLTENELLIKVKQPTKKK